MSTGKKLVVWLLIIIATVAFLFMGLVVTMMLAPGLEIFGVKYVSAKVGKYKFSNSVSYSSPNIVLNTGDVPVEVTFGMSGSLGLEFVQHFQGFTKSADTAGVKITNGEGNPYVAGDNTVVFDISEYKKFVWANSMQDYHLTLRLPATYSSTGTIKINSSRSDITLKGITKNLTSLDINTKGKIDLENNIVISGDLNISSNSALTLGSNINISGNLVANMGNEDLTITNAVGKDITFKSGAGNLSFNTCKNLTAETGSGNINKPSSNMISGSLNFTSTSGSVEIGTVLGAANRINTRSGHIQLGSVAGSLEVATLRSKPFVLGDVHNTQITIEGTSSPIINSVTGNLTVKAYGSTSAVTCGAITGNTDLLTKDGNITLNGAVSGNLTATTNNGAITAGTIGGKVSISSQRGRVNIDTINGTNNVINNQRGSVSVATVAHDLKVDNSFQASYSLGSVDTLNFNATYSSLNVGSVSTSLKVVTNANVTAGTNGDVANATISAGRADIVLKNSVGTVQINGVGHTITLQNKSSQDIKINKYLDGGVWKDLVGGSKVVATGLKGHVSVYSANSIDLTFAEVTDNVDVVSGSGSVSGKVTIDATCARYNTVNYDLNTQTNSSPCRVYYGDSEHTDGTQSSAQNNNVGVDIKIKVKTSGAPIELRLAV